MSRILIIDDDDQYRMMIRIMLEQLGHEITDTFNGLEAIKLFKEEPFDLVITDIIMPGKEGIEIIIELKGFYSDVKIITMSGSRYLDLAKGLGSIKTLVKPFSTQELIDAVKELLITV